MNESARPAYRIADLPADERPANGWLTWAPGPLDPPNFLAILLRVGVPGRVLFKWGSACLLLIQKSGRIASCSLRRFVQAAWGWCSQGSSDQGRDRIGSTYGAPTS